MKNDIRSAVSADRSLAVFLAGLASLALAACGNLTAGGVGQADVYVSGNHEPPAPSPSVSPSPVPARAEDDEADEAEGEVEIDFEVFLVTESGGQVRLGEDVLSANVDLQGVSLDEAVVDQQISAVRYVELRIVFEKIDVEIEGGLVIDGVPILGEVRVELEDLSLLVARAIDIDIQDGQTIALVLDLNAPAWLTAVDPITRTVDETVFAGLMNVVVSTQTEP